MAGNPAVPSSVNHTNFIVNNIDLKSINLLNDQAYLIYDGTRIKWQHNLRSLKNFVENKCCWIDREIEIAWRHGKAI